MHMELFLIKGKYLEQTSYILLFGSDAIMVDCGVPFCEIEAFLATHNATLLGIFITHGHFDHSYGAAEAQRKGVKIYASEFGDRITLSNKDLARFMGVHFEKYSADNLLRGGTVVEFPFASVKCIYTPGHSVDGMCYIIDNILFSGDTLVNADFFGNLRFPTGSATEMRTSLCKLFNDYSDLPCLHGHEQNAPYGITLFAPIYTVGYSETRCGYTELPAGGDL